jgi:UDP-glucose 4-epimerase
MHILVTGGTGYIGSHTVLELLNQNYKVTVVDNLSNSSEVSLKRVEELTGKKASFDKIDLRDEDKLDSLFKRNEFDGVIHFAGLKSPDESAKKPLEYYHNNLGGTLGLLEIMQKYNVKTLIFSSSANVYGEPESVPVKESEPLKPTNPYGQTKMIIEQILKDMSNAKNGWLITSLRYFNPIGAHKSGEIGEDPNGIPNNLLPYISQVAMKKLDKVHVFGNDYPTIDGTGVRDYIHVVDLAKAHIAALQKPGKPNDYRVCNIGTGKGASVLEMVEAFKKASGREIPYIVDSRRPGDSAICYSDPSLANKELDWKAELTIEEACRDAWNWQSKNPKGYICVE